MTRENAILPSIKGKASKQALLACAACTLFTVVNVGIMVYGIYTREGGSRLLAMLGSTGFVSLALVSGGMRHGFGRLVFIGLCFCWLGDYLGPIQFEAGVSMFCLAHVAFCAGFLVHGISKKYAMLAVIPATVVTAVVVAWVVSHVPGALKLVVAYGLIIGSMVILSAGMLPTGRAGRIAFAAAVIFYISDIFVARGHYVAPGYVNSLGCYPLYYSACLLFGWSAALAARREPE